jgi:hypothetical protein
MYSTCSGVHILRCAPLLQSPPLLRSTHTSTCTLYSYVLMLQGTCYQRWAFSGEYSGEQILRTTPSRVHLFPQSAHTPVYTCSLRYVPGVHILQSPPVLQSTHYPDCTYFGMRQSRIHMFSGVHLLQSAHTLEFCSPEYVPFGACVLWGICVFWRAGLLLLQSA